MKLAKMSINLGYVVDLDNPEMVEYAKECLYEDIMSMVKYDEVVDLVQQCECVESPDLTEDDIPEFLVQYSKEFNEEEVEEEEI
jgi:hypothetical protein